MRWSGRDVALAMLGGSVGGGLAALMYAWVKGQPLWQPGQLGIALVLGTLIGFLCTRWVRPNDL